MPLFGILNVNKPAGLTSRDAVDRIQRLVRPAKSGHAGTLDPLATGVLVICVGQATRLIQYVQQMPKTYRATFLLGCRSETDDLEGEVVPVDGAPIPSREQLDQVLPRFVGEIAQRPPEYSAILVAGKRAYARARRGEQFELAPRMITIHRLAVRRYEYPELDLDIECGSGTYVRALGRDLAASLGTAAVMSALERTAIGAFHVENASSLDDLTAETLPKHLQSPLTALAALPHVVLTDAEHIEIRHGRPIAKHAGLTSGQPVPPGSVWAAVDAEGRLIAILFEKLPDEFWPRMNFIESQGC